MEQSKSVQAWVHFPGEVQDDPAWEAFSVPSASTPSPEGRSTQRQFAYEFLLVIAMSIGIVGALLWQQSQSRLALLEAQVKILQESRASASVQNGMASSAVDGAPVAVPPVLETTYFRFFFSAADANIVAQVATTSDVRYLKLRQELGLALPTSSEKLTIQLISSTPNPNSPSPSPEAPPDIVLPSPTHKAATGETASAEWLADELLNRLARRALDAALQNREIKQPWQVMINGLYLHFSRNEWERDEWATTATYLWIRHRAQQVDLTSVLQASELQSEVGRAFDGIYSHPVGWTTDPYGTYSLADPLLEYILHTYGRAAVPQLLDAFTQYETWDALLPAVFGMTATEFQEEWHAYLRERYPHPRE